MPPASTENLIWHEMLVTVHSYNTPGAILVLRTGEVAGRKERPQKRAALDRAVGKEWAPNVERKSLPTSRRVAGEASNSHRSDNEVKSRHAPAFSLSRPAAHR
ncbi:hypothetical protein BURKHO8Y_140303 [Burkholderia sp. 8Y]|nr:hypothetical protein BURKHO8Y_140303 [Burkholderia sp. 8Y]